MSLNCTQWREVYAYHKYSKSHKPVKPLPLNHTLKHLSMFSSYSANGWTLGVAGVSHLNTRVILFKNKF